MTSIMASERAAPEQMGASCLNFSVYVCMGIHTHKYIVLKGYVKAFSFKTCSVARCVFNTPNPARTHTLGGFGLSLGFFNNCCSYI